MLGIGGTSVSQIAARSLDDTVSSADTVLHVAVRAADPTPPTERPVWGFRA